MNSWDFIGSVYQCNARALSTMQVNKNLVTDVSQNHLTGKANSDVNFLDLSEQNFQSLPKGIEKFFTKLEGIRAYRNNLRVISKEDLKPFASLKYINFYNNELTTLDSDLFSLSPKLEYLNFGFNKLRNVGRNTFLPLKQLKQLYVHDGKMCINQHATTPEEVASLIFDLTVYCPPTYEMFMADIWKDENFVAKIEELVANKVASLAIKVELLAEKLARFQNSISNI